MNFAPMATLTQSQLAQRYGVTQKTFRRWLKPFQEELGILNRVLTPRQVVLIHEKLGAP